MFGGVVVGGVIGASLLYYGIAALAASFNGRTQDQDDIDPVLWK